MINFLDDCQDLLFTALVLGRPLLRRLPAYWLPGLGWVLVANDLLNLGTGVLSVALGGRSWKRATLDVMEKLSIGRTRRLNIVHRFFEASVLWPAIIQGGQALESLTGYGLTLGTLMGAITDSFWSVIGSVQGTGTLIKAPPPSDPLGKAARVLVQGHTLAYIAPLLNREDLDVAISATAVAEGIVKDSLPTNRIFPRALQLEDVPVPTFQVWNEESRAALDAEGEKWEDDGGEDLYPIVPTPFPYPSFADALPLSALTMPRTEQIIRTMYGPTNHGTAMSLLYLQATLEPWEWQADGLASFTPVYEDLEQDLAAAVEYGVWPTKEVDGPTLELWLKSAREIAKLNGYTRASFDSLKAAANLNLGGWTRRQFATFTPL